MAEATLTMTLSPEAADAVRGLAVLQGVAPEEVVRRALSTEAFLLRRRAAGQRVLLLLPGGKYKEVMPHG